MTQSTRPQSSACLKFRRRRAGVTITEVALTLIIFAMMTMLFAAVFPMTIRGAQYSGNYSQAAMIAQHKMDQLRSTGAGGLTPGHLADISAIDQSQPTGYPLTVPGGATYSFTTADSLVNDGTTHGYFAPGSQGLVTIADYTAVHNSSGIPAGTLYYVTVTVNWVGGGVSNGSYTTSSIIAKT